MTMAGRNADSNYQLDSDCGLRCADNSRSRGLRLYSNGRHYLGPDELLLSQVVESSELMLRCRHSLCLQPGGKLPVR
jgi:hypothetical protein